MKGQIMPALFELSSEAKDIIAEELNLADIAEVIDEDYKGRVPINEDDRERLQKFLIRNRGSARIKLGLFRTKEENDKRESEAKAMKLP